MNHAGRHQGAHRFQPQGATSLTNCCLLNCTQTSCIQTPRSPASVATSRDTSRHQSSLGTTGGAPVSPRSFVTVTSTHKLPSGMEIRSNRNVKKQKPGLPKKSTAWIKYRIVSYFLFLKWGSPVPPSVAALTGSWAEAFGYSETGSLGPHQN